MTLPLCRASWLGRVPYLEGWDLQRQLAQSRATGTIPDTLLLLEHPPVYTTGRRRADSHLRLPPAVLGAPLIETDRGGDITFHGPGQLVAYPIVDLKGTRMGISGYVRALEEVIIATLQDYGIAGQRQEGLTGVWVGNDKIAAIGVRVSRPCGAAGAWVTLHGLALNVAVEMEWFRRIVPCGIPDRGVTSLAALLGRGPPLQEAADRLARHFCRIFRRRLRTVGRQLLFQAVVEVPRGTMTKDAVPRENPRRTKTDDGLGSSRR